MSEYYPFKPGYKYSRKDVFQIIGIDDPRGGPWYTGYAPYKGDHFVFCGVGTTGRTGHNYYNRFIGDELIWFGKTQSKLHHKSIQSLLNPSGHVYLFFRENDRDDFTFAGLAYPKTYKDSSPVKITWIFDGTDFNRPEVPPEEVSNPVNVLEGAKKEVIVNRYERDPNARRQCINYWGVNCAICSFDFEKVYGDLGKGFIHVHHLNPLSEVGEEYMIDPVQDLRPVCPNCHAMLHRKQPALSISELENLVMAENDEQVVTKNYR